MANDLKKICAYFCVLVGMLTAMIGGVIFLFGFIASAITATPIGVLVSFGAFGLSIGGFFVSKWAMKFLRNVARQ